MLLRLTPTWEREETMKRKECEHPSFIPSSPRRYSQSLPTRLHPPRCSEARERAYVPFLHKPHAPTRRYGIGQVERPLESLPLFEVLLILPPQGLFSAKPYFFAVQVPSNLCCFRKQRRSKISLARATLARIKRSPSTVLLYSTNKEQKKEDSQNQRAWTRENCVSTLFLKTRLMVIYKYRYMFNGNI